MENLEITKKIGDIKILQEIINQSKNPEKDINLSSIPILYEDNHIIVVIKPSGIASQKDKQNNYSLIECIKSYLIKKYNKKGDAYLGLVHRLDLPTTGIMVFAKTSKSAARLSKSIQKKEFKKRYYAVLKGKFDGIKMNEEIYLENFLRKDQKLNKSFVCKKEDKNAKKAEMLYTIKGYNVDKNLSLVEIQLLTGRHHQIRVQMSNLKHPVLHDSKYDKKYSSHELGLFAYDLEFKHPTKDIILKFKIDPVETNEIYLKIFKDNFKR